MKKVIYLLSAAAVLTVGIISCSKEQAIQNANVTELENKNGRPDGAGQSSERMMELALSTELRNLALEKTPELGTLIHDQPISTVDANGNVVEGVIRISLNAASGRISRIEISENVAKPKGVGRNALINADFGDDVIENAAAAEGCLRACNSDYDDDFSGCSGDPSCERDVKQDRGKCKRKCWNEFGLSVAAALCKLLC